MLTMEPERQKIRQTYRKAHDAIDMMLTWAELTDHQRRVLTDASNALETANKALRDVRVLTCINGMCV